MRSITLANIKERSLAVAQKIGAAITAPSSAQIQVALFVIGTVVLSAGLAKAGFAQIDVQVTDNEVHYNDTQISQAVVAILTYIEGSFGALVMVGAGIAAILSSAFGQYRAALGCLVVAVGAFILRSVMSTFFNTQSIDEGAQ
jgi:hypothetical protein